MRDYFYCLTLSITMPNGTTQVETAQGEVRTEPATRRTAVLSQCARSILDKRGFSSDFDRYAVLFFTLDPAEVEPWADLS